MNISLKNISFSYSDSLDDAILENLNLEIRSGECVVLAGESGCGKTTISKLINGLIPHYHSGTMDGDVLLGDKNTADMTLAEISRCVGSVFQNPRSQFSTLTRIANLLLVAKIWEWIPKKSSSAWRMLFRNFI